QLTETDHLSHRQTASAKSRRVKFHSAPQLKRVIVSPFMWVISWSILVTCWFAWIYPFLFRAPHRQDRQSITVAGPTRLGLAMESVAIILAFLFRQPAESPPGLLRQAVGMLIGPASAVMAWHAVKHLGRQFRLHAGLYVDHQLVRSGPYAIVRHPIY